MNEPIKPFIVPDKYVRQEFPFETTHDLSATPEYKTWAGVKKRCLNPNGMDKITYAGVKMFPAWVNDPVEFIRYMGQRPSPDHSIDRWPNRKGDYVPGNVRWATWTQQNRNKEAIRLWDLNGEFLCIPELAERFNIPYATLYQRLMVWNWSLEKSISKPVKSSKEKIHYQGKDRSLREMCRIFKVCHQTVRYRVQNKGWELMKALTEPTHTKLT